ncbi:hypothetical protein ABPG75_000239 [Micractinium tetrahymenae]
MRPVAAVRSHITAFLCTLIGSAPPASAEAGSEGLSARRQQRRPPCSKPLSQPRMMRQAQARGRPGAPAGPALPPPAAGTTAAAMDVAQAKAAYHTYAKGKRREGLDSLEKVHAESPSAATCLVGAKLFALEAAEAAFKVGAGRETPRRSAELFLPLPLWSACCRSAASLILLAGPFHCPTGFEAQGIGKWTWCPGVLSLPHLAATVRTEMRAPHGALGCPSLRPSLHPSRTTPPAMHARQLCCGSCTEPWSLRRAA